MPEVLDSTPSKQSYPGNNGAPMTPARPKGRIPAPQSIRIVGPPDALKPGPILMYLCKFGEVRELNSQNEIIIDDEGHSYSVADCSFGDSTTAERILSQRKHFINGLRVRIE
ncbi:hypothetical protein Pmar_PMAR006356 [Perkinsus marinus ATCC 50983]|uniref:RRM domain-containing protein n=1 Tax=Perkinsus marinus (strain ATCC 50983 / TXsc) TaxID=423536 RepID=C5K9G6_PERM5|nr:hypothetical protein Pmar_PMAR006356 [Perkinsus marinus ATCC 50983]EER18738.1 hypothetical protein Pmar_PMAR006356 [Perkinsus marinus ATCC 50983]|eukprot:XP_002786942.1 hypothetical protein Pmar_PMAR006356 [Perkinsus marinus ATCC 50983]